MKRTAKRQKQIQPETPSDEEVLIACPDCKKDSRFGKGRIGETRFCPVCKKHVVAVLDRTHFAFDWFAPHQPEHIKAQGRALLSGILQGIARGGV